MNISFVVPYYQPDMATLSVEQLLFRRPVHRELPGELALRGHAVSLFHLAPYEREFQLNGVRYRFVRSGLPARLVGRAVGRLKRSEAAHYEPTLALSRAVLGERPALVHIHGATLNSNVFLMLTSLKRAGVPSVLHYHGGYPAKNPVGRALQRRNFDRAARLLFTTRSHARPFESAGVLRHPGRLVEFMETSSPFHWRPREEARAVTGMVGNPVFLWAGRLATIKDPLTAIQGFELLLPSLPNASLYLYFLTDELLGEIRSYVDARPSLRQALHFRGRAPFEAMEAIYNSSDFLLQASRREFSGCAVLEAMSCGVIPVVTDIPSFRSMTADGEYGVLFPPGDPRALAAGTLERLQADGVPRLSLAVERHFRSHLSFQALAEKLESVFQDVLSERASTRRRGT